MINLIVAFLIMGWVMAGTWIVHLLRRIKLKDIIIESLQAKIELLEE